MVPIGVAAQGATPRTLMNYYYDPEVAAQVAAWVNYITPVQGAQEAMADIDPELVENPMIFPTTRSWRRSRVPDADPRRGGALQRRVPRP